MRYFPKPKTRWTQEPITLKWAFLFAEPRDLAFSFSQLLRAQRTGCKQTQVLPTAAGHTALPWTAELPMLVLGKTEGFRQATLLN